MAEMAISRVRAATGARTVKRRVAKNGWSARRERLFLETLAATSNVSASCKAAKVSDTSVYRRRSTDATFAAAWMAALCEGFARLEMELLHRALSGVPKQTVGGDGRRTTTREFSERLALGLLAHHGKTVAEERARQAVLREGGSGDGSVQRLIDRLSEMSGRLAVPVEDGAADVD
jgi:hypothetical protein